MSQLPSVTDAYNTIAQDFSRTRQAVWPEFQLFLPYLEPYKHQLLSVLDLGCGNGRAREIFKDFNCRYSGLDISAELIHEAQKLHPHETFFIGNMTELPLPDHSQDVITVIAAFHHLPNQPARQQTMQEIRRVLKPNGVVFMTNWYLWQQKYWRPIWNALRHGHPRDLLIPWKNNRGEIMAERYYHAFTDRELRKLFRATNFSVVYQGKHRFNFVSILRPEGAVDN